MIYYNTYVCFPIWEDIYQSTSGTGLSGLDSATAEVYKGEDILLFSGVVKKRPGDAYLRLRVNDIVAPYVRARLELPTSEETGWVDDSDGASAGVMPLFKISWNGGALVRRFYVFGDWSWDRSRRYVFDPFPICQASILSEPIDGKFVEGQYLVFTDLFAKQLALDFSVRISDTQIGATLFKYIYRTAPGEVEALEGPATFFCRVSGFPNAYKNRYGAGFYKDSYDVTDTYGGVGPLYKIDSCNRYVLYYLNAFGGWDWFVIQGRVVESDAIERSEYTRRPSTADPMSRGRDVLQTSISKHLELHTHWLTDEEAGRMHHLTESPAVYVHDLITDIISPAVMTGTSHVFKTYKNQGRRLVSYQLDMDMAVTTERR